MNTPKLGEFCWNELATSDVHAAKEFYGTLLGWKFTDHDMGTMTYTMIQVGDDAFGGIWAIPKDKSEEIPPHWMGYILVEHLETTVEQAKKLGGLVVMPVTPVSDFGIFAIIQDPTGAHIAFWQALK